jgi:hypothetical protein
MSIKPGSYEVGDGRFWDIWLVMDTGEQYHYEGQDLLDECGIQWGDTVKIFAPQRNLHGEEEIPSSILFRGEELIFHPDTLQNGIDSGYLIFQSSPQGVQGMLFNPIDGEYRWL